MEEANGVFPPFNVAELDVSPLTDHSSFSETFRGKAASLQWELMLWNHPVIFTLWASVQISQQFGFLERECDLIGYLILFII